MFNKTETLKGNKLRCLDGEIGEVSGFYFDDKHWTVRYLVADTMKWLPARTVLISPYALGGVNREEGTISVHLTQKQVEGSPAWNADNPVSWPFEEAYHGYYGWPLYWEGTDRWGSDPYIARDQYPQKTYLQDWKKPDHHLYSTRLVGGFFIQATDGEIGHAVDFILDDETWAIRYLVIDARAWWPGKQVLVSPRWIRDVSGIESKISVDLSREAIQLSPEYDQEILLSRDYEAGLYRHYDRQGYWVHDPAAKENHTGALPRQ